MAFPLFFLTGCTVHFTNRIADRLSPTELYSAYNVNLVDLSLRSKCKKQPSVIIINAETRTEDFVALVNPPTTGVINPQNMMYSVVSYLNYGFTQSNIKVTDSSTKILQVKMIDLKSTAGFWSFGSYFKLSLTIPEIGLTKTYESHENAGLGHTAAAYAIHSVTRQIIDDPEVQNYILCR
jgi:hypothetical protein